MNREKANKCCWIFSLLLVASGLIAGGSYYFQRFLYDLMFKKLASIVFYIFGVLAIVFFVLTIVSIVLFIVASVGEDD